MAVAIAATVGFVSCKPKDADVKTAIEEKIKNAPELAGVTVSDVKDGVVTLTGELKDAAAVTKAEELLKDLKGVKSIANNLTVAAPVAPIAPIIVSGDDALSKAVTDAVKDFAGVTANVKNSVVTLSGSIAKTSLPKLMMTLQALHPKKVENKLTIK